MFVKSNNGRFKAVQDSFIVIYDRCLSGGIVKQMMFFKDIKK